MLAGSFLEENRSRLGLASLRLSSDAQAALLDYAWPGNVRELEHLIGRSALKALASQAEHPRILSLTAAHLGLDDTQQESVNLDASTPETAAQDFRTAVTSFERTVLQNALARNNENWASTARELQIDRANLNRLAKRLGLK